MQACSLVLGGGGLKACAHIGMLQACEEEQIPIEYIAGASSGAMIAAFYAMGYSAEELKKVMFEYAQSPLDFRIRPIRAASIILQSVLNLLKIGKRKAPLGLIRGQQLETYLRKYYGNQTFEGLRYPLLTTAVDLCSSRLQIFTNKEVAVRLQRRKEIDIHTDADLVTAVRASTAIPGIFTPVHYKGMVLVDGGIKGVIPANVVKWAGGKNIIAIDLATLDRPEEQFDDIFAVLWETIEIMGEEVAELILEQNTDLVIHPGLSDVWLTDYEKIQSVYDEGYRVTKEKMPEIRALLEGRKVPKENVRRRNSGDRIKHVQ